MREPTNPLLAKWPFYLGDALLVATACWAFFQGQPGLGRTLVVPACVAAGALLSITPFVLEYRALVKLMEAGALTTVVGQIEKLEQIAASVVGATAHWQEAHEQAQKAVTAAKEISERMASEVRAFTEFMERANNSEKATLRLETEKLRRAERDWLDVSVFMLDHVYAVHQGAVRSGQANLIAQMGHFQKACRDAARFVGLTPFVANEAEPFDPQRHQVAETDPKPNGNAVVGETLAVGYTFQGRLLRRATVRLRPAEAAAASEGSTPSGADTPAPDPQNQSPPPTAAPETGGS
jgi:molecular chaperone GrpE (heat shock protein)